MKKLLTKYLCHSDCVELLLLSHGSIACADLKSLKQLLVDLGKFLYFDVAKLIHVNLPSFFSQRNPHIDMLDLNYPPEFWEVYLENRFYLTDTMVSEFLMTYKPVHWHSLIKETGPSPASQTALDFKMDDAWEHGIVDTHSKDCSVLFLSGQKIDGGNRDRTILEYIVPFISQAYLRVLNNSQKSLLKLTSREVEVLQWIKEGKSSWEISIILRCSKRTVDFHTSNIKRKLNAVSRAQAVALGLQHGLIKF